MKHTLFKSLFFTTFLLAFVVGCGKDGGGGGGSSSNPLTGGSNLSGNSSAYYQELSNWYNAAENTSTIRPFLRGTKTLTQNTGSSDPCPGGVQKEFLGLKYCYYSGSSSSGGSNGYTVKYYKVGLLPTDASIVQYCESNSSLYDCVGSVANYGGKANNGNLQAALNSASQGLYLQSVSKLGSTVYQLNYTRSSMDSTPVKIFVINTALHSIYNPIQVIDGISNVQELTQLY